MSGKYFSRGVHLLADWLEFDDAIYMPPRHLAAEKVQQLVEVGRAHMERVLKVFAVPCVTDVEQRFWDDADELLEQRRKERKRALDRKKAQKERKELWGELDAAYAA